MASLHTELITVNKRDYKALIEALEHLVVIADKSIPQPDCGLSNSALYEAEEAIADAFKVLANLKVQHYAT